MILKNKAASPPPQGWPATTVAAGIQRSDGVADASGASRRQRLAHWTTFSGLVHSKIGATLQI